MTPSARPGRRGRVDLTAATMAELSEVTERLAVVRDALAVVTPKPEQATAALGHLRHLLADLRAISRRLDDLSAVEVPGASTCDRCGRPLPDGRPRRWCSHACRQRAYEARRGTTADPSQ